MSTDVDILSHFGELDGLIRPIYHGFDQFVVLSTVTESSWSVYVGLKGPEGRWWRGSWSAHNITQFIGSRSGPKILERFAHNLSEAFISGELSVGGWTTPDSERGTRIMLTLGNASKKPVQIPLVELSAKEAASHAMTVFGAVAVDAQSRKCRLIPPSFSVQSAVAPGPSGAKGGSGSVGHGHSSRRTHVRESPGPVHVQMEEETAAARKIKSLEAELAQVKATKRAKSESPSSEPEPKRTVFVRPPKGASLANPHKKARRYQEVEFGSGDD